MDFYFLFCSPQGTINRDKVNKNSNFVLCFCTPTRNALRPLLFYGARNNEERKLCNQHIFLNINYQGRQQNFAVRYFLTAEERGTIFLLKNSSSFDLVELWEIYVHYSLDIYQQNWRVFVAIFQNFIFVLLVRELPYYPTANGLKNSGAIRYLTISQYSEISTYINPMMQRILETV